MNITNTPLNFKARYLQKADIEKRKLIGYAPYEASFIEFDTKYRNDRKAIKTFMNDCGDKSVLKGMLDLYEPENTHIVAITTQTEDFKNADPEKILGLMRYSIYEDGDIFVSRLQTKPEYKHGFLKFLRKYSNVGKTQLKRLMNMDDTKTISLFPVNSAVPFYKKLGFKYEDSPYMEWHSKAYYDSKK